MRTRGPGHEMLVGAGSFLDDNVPRGTLYATFVRSDLASAQLTGLGIPTSIPVGAFVHTSETLDAPSIPARLRPSAPAATGMDRPILVEASVRHEGEAIALVLAESAMLAFDLADDVWPELEPLPAVVDATQARRDEILVFPEVGTNIVDHRRLGRVDVEMPSGPVKVSTTTAHPRLSAAPIEPLAVLAIPGDEGVEVHCGHQAPHRLLRELQGAYPDTKFRVRVPDVGGSFGLKGQLYPEYVAVVAAALQHGRPVLWRERRREQLVRGMHGRGLRHRVDLVGDRSGRIHAIHIDVLGDLGAYPQSGWMVPVTAATIASGPYAVEHVIVEMATVVTNTAPTGPYRGAGRPEAAIALEKAIDRFASRIGKAPEAVRRLNLLTPGDLPYTSPTGLTYDGGDYGTALDLALEAAGVTAARTEQAERQATGADPLGVGIATFLEPAGGAVGTGEYGSVEVEDDGVLSLRTGSTSAGQPHAETWRQVVGGIFDVPPEAVRFTAGDTGLVANGEGTYGSRSTPVGAEALARTGLRVLQKARSVAAEMLEVAVEDLVVQSGGFVVAGSPGTHVSLEDIHRSATNAGIRLFEEEFYVPGHMTFPYGTHVAIVTVGRETGEIHLRRIVAVDDCGVVINAAAVDGQLRGGIVQALGAAIFECLDYSANGQLLNGTLIDYPMPRASDLPPIILGQLTTPAATELGAKGVGESGMVGASAAILNAVLDALRPDGVVDLDLPLRPNRVWKALMEARQDARSVGQ